ncbi:hypothetical protein ACJMK2_040140 [Sinanodonta woodiana]
MCSCPDAIQCPRNWEDNSRSVYVYKTLPSNNNDREDEVLMKLSFCRPLTAHFGRMCNKFEPVITLSGPGGPFLFKLESPGMRCQCRRGIYLNRSWSQGIFSFEEYSCGKPKCNPMAIDSDTCMTVSNVRDPSYFLQHRLEHNYPCRCPRGHFCHVDTDQLSKQTGGHINGFCKSIK